MTNGPPRRPSGPSQRGWLRGPSEERVVSGKRVDSRAAPASNASGALRRRQLGTDRKIKRGGSRAASAHSTHEAGTTTSKTDNGLRGIHASSTQERGARTAS